MDSAKYIGLDVHKESISIAVMNTAAKIVMECAIETKAITPFDIAIVGAAVRLETVARRGQTGNPSQYHCSLAGAVI